MSGGRTAPIPAPNAPQSPEGAESGGVRRATAQRRATSIVHLTRVLGAGNLVALIALIILYIESGVGQMLAAAGCTLLTAVCVALAYRATHRGKLDLAGSWLIGGIVVTYGGAAFLWEGVTPELAGGGALLIILVGSIAIPHKRALWSAAIVALIIYLWIIEVFQPVPRYNVTHGPAAYLIVSITTATFLATLWQAIRLGRRVTALEEVVDDLQSTDQVLRRELAELTVLHAVAVAGTEATSEDELLERATQLIGKTFYPDNFGILLTDPKAGLLRPHPSYRSKVMMPMGAGIPLNMGIVGLVATDGQVRRVSDVTREPAYLQITPGMRSKLCVPLRIGAEMIGVINAESLRENAFSENDERLLVTFAGQLATAISRLRSIEATEHQAQRIAMINDVGQRANAILTLDELLPEIARLIGETLDLYNVEIALIEGGKLIFCAGHGGYTAGALEPGYSLNLGQGITGKAAATGKTLLVPEVGESPDYVHYAPLPNVRAELAVPLTVKGEIIGVLDIKSDHSYGLDETDAAILEILASQVAIAVQNARLFDALQERTRELGGLYEVALATSSVLEPEALLKSLYGQIRRLLAPDLFVAALYDDETKEVNIAYAMQGDAPIPDIDGIHIPLEEGGLNGWVIQTRTPLLIKDLHNAEPPVQPRYVGQTRTWLGVPLIARDRIIGALSIQSFLPNAFNETQCRLLESLASQVAVALENARLYLSAVKSAERLSILHQASQEIISAGIERERVYMAIHKAASKLMPTEAFVIALVDETQQQIDLPYLVDKGKRYPSQRVTMDEGISGYVIRTGEPLRTRDVSQLEAVKAQHFGDSAPVRSALAVPMRLGGRVLGMLSAQSYELRSHTQDDQNLLEMLAAHAAVALENARLFEAEHARIAELETLRQASLALTSSLELNFVLQTILENVLRLAKADGTHIFLYDGERLRFGAARWAGEAQRQPFADPYEHGVTYTVARSGKPLVIPDTRGHPMFTEAPWDGAIAGLPLRTGEQTVGVMNVAFQRPHAFNENELRALALLGDQAAIAIRNAELFEAAHRRLQELTTLHAVATAGAEATDENALIERATELIGKTLYPDNFGILLLNASGEALHFHSSYGGINESIMSQSIPVGQGITGLVARDGKPRRIPDITKDPHCVVFMPEMRSELCVPLKAGDRIIGIVNAESKRENAFTANDERLLMTFANQLATAIEKARLFAEITEALEREQRLNEIARTISGTLELPAILREVVRTAAELVRAKAGVLILAPEDPKALAQAYVFNAPHSVEKHTVPPDHGIVGEIIRSGEPILLADYKDHPNAASSLVREGMQGFIGVPVSIGAKVVGALGLFRPGSANSFTSRDLALMESIGLQTGIALQNARLFAQEQQHAAELAAALERLTELDKLKSEFIQNVSHEFRTPLAIIRGYSDLLRRGELGEVQDAQQEPLNIIARRAEMLSCMIEDLTAILEIEAQRLQAEQVDMTALVQAALSDFQISVGNAGLTLAAEIVPTPVKVVGDPLKLRRVLDNLVGNALKFTTAGGAITIRLHEETDTVVLEVADTGIGIPKDKLERIFERFYQVDGSMKRRYGGTGLGLALVKEIVEAHGGTIAVESVVNQGSTFRVTLPQFTVNSTPDTPA